eukprot:4157123-Amphidinium_carterae.3
MLELSGQELKVPEWLDSCYELDFDCKGIAWIGPGAQNQEFAWEADRNHVQTVMEKMGLVDKRTYFSLLASLDCSGCSTTRIAQRRCHPQQEEKVRSRILRLSSVDTLLNSADLGTKYHGGKLPRLSIDGIITTLLCHRSCLHASVVSWAGRWARARDHDFRRGCVRVPKNSPELVSAPAELDCEPNAIALENWSPNMRRDAKLRRGVEHDGPGGTPHMACLHQCGGSSKNPVVVHAMLDAC